MDAKGQVVQLKENYLSLTGYRLPTEAEWEYGCRAGAATSRFFGESAELLGKFACYLQNSDEHSWPVGSKKPNDFGLFDMYGNVWNWCLDKDVPYPKGDMDRVFDDIEGILTVKSQDSRVLRGGSFDNRATRLRAAFRNANLPGMRYYTFGFRPARTF
jgi:formylglycine-generating enzyme required for sulfatase activity